MRLDWLSVLLVVVLFVLNDFVIYLCGRALYVVFYDRVQEAT